MREFIYFLGNSHFSLYANNLRELYTAACCHSTEKEKTKLQVVKNFASTIYMILQEKVIMLHCDLICGIISANIARSGVSSCSRKSATEKFEKLTFQSLWCDIINFMHYVKAGDILYYIIWKLKNRNTHRSVSKMFR